MRKYIKNIVSKCLNCKKVKYEQQSPVGLLQKMQISEWKWEIITMNLWLELLRL